MRPAVFLDLNGTLAEALSPEGLSLAPLAGAFEAIRLLTSAGYACPVVTVQGRIGTGLITEQQFRAAFSRFELAAAQHGAHLDGLYLCPHAASYGCPCRKPRTLLYQRAASDLEADLARSRIIGDTSLDLGASHDLGIPAILVRTGHGHAAQHDPTPRAAVVNDVLAAAHHVTSSIS